MEKNLESINKVCSAYLGESFEPAKTPEEALKAIIAFPEVQLTHEVHHVHQSIRQDGGSNFVTRFKGKSRTEKEGYTGKENDVTDITEFEALSQKGINAETFSRNPGVMKANQPNYRDELAEIEMRNRVVDMFTAGNENNPTAKAASYGGQNERSVYVGDISGHTSEVAAMLFEYAKSHKGEEKLSEDVNNFLTAFVATYVNQGFHSYLECVHVLHDPKVKDLFGTVGVDVNVALPPEILESAFRDTQEYTKGISQQKSMQEELMDKFSKNNQGAIRV